MTKITKRETIEGELGRFRLHNGEEPQHMYNRLKTLVNQVRNLGSKKWDDHEVVNVILRSLIFLNPTQVQLIRGDPRYTLMSPEEVIGKFVSFELMIKGSKKIIDHNGEEPQHMYNRLKTLVNQVRNLGSKKWDDHEVVNVILRSLIFLNPTQVQLIRGDPRYTLMSPEEVIGKFVSFELMIKGSKKIIEQGDSSNGGKEGGVYIK